MIPTFLQRILLLLKKILLLLVLFSFSRFVFYLSNRFYFASGSFAELTRVFLHGLRFDVSIILIFNSLFIFLYLIPGFRERKLLNRLLRGLFFGINGFLFLLNFIDTGYFPFTFKRSTADIFRYLAMSDDAITVAPQMLMDYWYLLFVFVGMLAAMVYFYNKTEREKVGKGESGKGRRSVVVALSYFLTFLLLIGVMILGIRGGFQLKPINIITAGEFTDAHFNALVLNTPFTIINTIGKKELTELKYFTPEEAEALFNPVKPGYGKIGKDTIINQPSTISNHVNVVVIILESFGNEYIGALNKVAATTSHPTFTPFLDSLIAESLVFENAFANGKTSITGIPSVVASLPTLMNESFITSEFAANQVNSIASLLKPLGYHSAFFHGGTNGTMGFDAFTRNIGFDKYYGRVEYGNETDYDGHWGIWDEEFFQYFADKLDASSVPFVSCIFSLTSHHPYQIPKRYEGKFQKGTLEIHQSIGYTDYSLKRFFNRVASTPWFDNTLFVITADHTSQSEFPLYQNDVFTYSVPILLYRHGADLKGRVKTVVQQSDIMPGVLDYLHYPKPYISFGESLLNDSIPHFAVNYRNGIYQIMEDEYMLQSDGTNVLKLYNFQKDAMLEHNLVNELPEVRTRLHNQLKAFVQQYNHRLIGNLNEKVGK